MPKTLQEYADLLDQRGLFWPQPPEIVSPKATPSTQPIEGIRAVTWSIYGTLLRISDGELLFDHPDAMRMQVALDKTIQEFNMWHSMTRKPGPPWEQLYRGYKDLLERQRMAGTKHKGDVPEVDSSSLWRTLIGRLQEKEYEYDVSLYGDVEEFSDKVAWFFHSSLQGIEASPHARDALTALSEAGIRQGLLADAQPFTLVQMLRALKAQGTLPHLGQLFDFDCVILSFQEGVRKPSKSLYRAAVEQFAELEIAPEEVLHVSSRVRDDLAMARQFGMKTALYAGDKLGLRAGKEDVTDPQLRPDRLLTDLSQIREVLGI